MTTVIELDLSQLQSIYDTNIQRAQAIASSAKRVSNDQFVFFAAFDGTNNDRNNAPAGEQSTNVYQLYEQAIETDSFKSQLKGSASHFFRSRHATPSTH